MLKAPMVDPGVSVQVTAVEITLNSAVASAWSAWNEAGDLPTAQLLGSQAFPDAGDVYPLPSDFLGTHTLAVTWNSYIPTDDFDIYIVVDFED